MERRNDQLEQSQATAALIEALYDWYISEPDYETVSPYPLARLLECARRALLRAMRTECCEAVAYSSVRTNPSESHYDYLLAEVINTMRHLSDPNAPRIEQMPQG